MSSNTAPTTPILTIKDISKILPHGYPFLLVDKIVHLDLEKNFIIGIKNVTRNEEFFQGHFPEVPIMPGVLILEALAQTGGILVHQKNQNAKIALLMSVNDAKFRKPVVPGDVLALHVTGLHLGSKGGKIRASALVEEQVAVSAEISFALVQKEQL